MSQQSLYKALHEAGVKVNLHYIPVYLQPYYARLGFKLGYCPHAEEYFKTAISIPIYSSMSEEQKNAVVGKIKSSFTNQIVKSLFKVTGIKSI